jgi:hypothetical protein
MANLPKMTVLLRMLRYPNCKEIVTDLPRYVHVAHFLSPTCLSLELKLIVLQEREPVGGERKYIAKIRTGRKHNYSSLVVGRAL